VNGHTRTQIEQSLLILVQYEKHFSPSIDHFVTPCKFDRLWRSAVGAPSGIAFEGQPDTHAEQISHISFTPNEIGRS
jgi:hypothetical protein